MKGVFIGVLIALIVGGLVWVNKTWAQQVNLVDIYPDGVLNGLDVGAILAHWGEPAQSPQGNSVVLNKAVCDPANGPFTLEINNPYLPMTVGMVNELENSQQSVRVTVLDETEVVAGVTTRVVEEYEEANGQLVEISMNYFAQAANGTVCYFGEHVDIYAGGVVVSHDGSWRAGDGFNKPGIMMPGSPMKGQVFRVEDSPGIAEEIGILQAMGVTEVTPAGTFSDTVFIQEFYEGDVSNKMYARGIGMIDDGEMKLASRGGPGITVSPTPTPPIVATPTPFTGVSILPPEFEQPIQEELMQFASLPGNIKEIVNQRHPVYIIIEVKRETYSNGAIVYTLEIVIDGHLWEMEILPDGNVIIDRLEVPNQP